MSDCIETDRLAALLAVGFTASKGYGDDFWHDYAARLIAAREQVAPTPDPLPLEPDDHGHTGRLWCDPCVGHGVMLEQGIHRCAPTPDPAGTYAEGYADGRADEAAYRALTAPTPDPLREAAATVKVSDDQIRAALKSLGNPAALDEAIVWTAANGFLALRAALASKEADRG